MIDNKIKNRTSRIRRQDKENFYITSDMIYDEWLVWKQTGEVTERFGQYMLMIARGVCRKPSFRNYPADMKDEVVQDSCMYIMKNLKNMKEEFRNSFFNYLTRTAYCSWYMRLRKHYRDVNKKKALLLAALENAFRMNPTPENAAVIANLQKEIEAYEHA